jgi:hypothetical protein
MGTVVWNSEQLWDNALGEDKGKVSALRGKLLFCASGNSSDHSKSFSS